MGIKKRILSGIGVFGALVMGITPFYGVVTSANEDLTSKVASTLMSEEALKDLEPTAPTVNKPKWYTNVTFYYSVSTDGSVGSGLEEFASLANATLNDSRGWTRLGVQFKRVASGGNFRLILAEASRLPSYSSGCSADWSCNVGNNVIINDDRWEGASAAWNANGGSLRDYRHMVVNHETGHWLGHGHASCGATGSLAPVMQQQSIDLMGCTFNPWPLDSELWSTRL